MTDSLGLAMVLRYVERGVCSRHSRSKILEEQHNLACSGNGSGLGWIKLRVSVRDEAAEMESGCVMGGLYALLWTPGAPSWH